MARDKVAKLAKPLANKVVGQGVEQVSIPDRIEVFFCGVDYAENFDFVVGF